MVTRDEHWRKMERRRTAAGLPAHAFDFISVHDRAAFRIDGVLVHPKAEGAYSLVAPLAIVDRCKGKRPAWEGVQFNRKAECIAFARLLVASYGKAGLRTYIVDCCDPRHPAVRKAA